MTDPAPTTPTRSDVLDEIRPPRRPLDPDWSTATLDAVLRDAPHARPVPDRRPWPSRRSRAVAVGATGVLTVGLGVTAAAAAQDDAASGFTRSFVAFFDSWAHDADQREADDPRPAVDPAGAERLASRPGPGGTTFSVVSADGPDGYACTATLFETPASAARPVPEAFVDADGSSCRAIDPQAPFASDLAVDVQRLPDVLGVGEVVVYSLSAGEAATVELRSGGRPQPPGAVVLTEDGRFHGWYAGDPTVAATLVALDADGVEIDRVRVL